MAPGMFTNLCLILLLLLAGSLQFRNFTFNHRKKAKKKSRKSSNTVQLADGVISPPMVLDFLFPSVVTDAAI